MKTTDPLTPELRRAEKEIDNHYKSNPLVKLPYVHAAWALLTFAEDSRMLKPTSFLPTSQEVETVSDNFVNQLNEPMRWLSKDCEQGGQIPFAYNAEVFRASQDLFKLGKKYGSFVAAYTYASHNWVGLQLHGSTIQPTDDLFTGLEYKAYGRLIKPRQSDEALSSVNDFDSSRLDTAIWNSLKVDGDRFYFHPTAKVVSDLITDLKPMFDKMFLLPGDWQFSRYSLGDFRKVFEVISVIALIRLKARNIAVCKGCGNRGYVDSVYVPTCRSLLGLVVRCSQVPKSKVRSIFNDLSYGNRGISNPDPALQPLIKLNSKRAVIPSFWCSVSPERNLTVLLNRLPSEKAIYSRLVDEKEEIMRQHFTSCLSAKEFRVFHGSVLLTLPDVDLAIISDSEKTCLLLELKWFIDPAEPREIIEKSEEIEKGVSQVLQLKGAFESNHEPLLEKLNIDSTYRLEGVVASYNWIGYANVQSPEVPVIQADHLIAKLKDTKDLGSVIEWLKARKYLPEEGKHFKVRRTTTTIGKWSLKWYGIEALIKDAFFPL